MNSFSLVSFLSTLDNMKPYSPAARSGVVDGDGAAGKVVVLGRTESQGPVDECDLGASRLFYKTDLINVNFLEMVCVLKTLRKKLW